MKFYSYFFITFLFISINIFSQNKPINKTSEKDIFVKNLMAKMTIDEKIGQLNLPSFDDFTTGMAKSSNVAQKIREGKVGGLFNIKTVQKIRDIQNIAVNESRLKIPLLFGMDVIHGYETTFPIPLALSATWNMDLIQKSARIAAQEASADGINWTFSPMVDICKDPRWGRIAEGSGEDPYLGSQIAKAMVTGYQGDDLSRNNTILSCVKHFALYGAAEAGRDYNTVDMSRIKMYNEYFPPFKAAFDAGCGSTMASFNEVDGIPATGNKWLLTDVLRTQWGFKGFVVSDYTGVNEMSDHGVGDVEHCSQMALNAGLNMDMVSEGFLQTLKQSVTNKKVSIAKIDESVRLILNAKYDLGLFKNPYLYLDENRQKTEIYTPENRKASREIAAESFVLLKNENQLLPLKKQGTIALIGPLANAKENMAGTWSVGAKQENSIAVLKGLKDAVGDKAKIVYAKGSNLDENEILEQNATMFGKSLNRNKQSNQELLDEAILVAQKSDIIVVALGESAEMNGECSSRTKIEIPQIQKNLLSSLLKIGKPVVLVLFTGRPLVLVDENNTVPSIINVWFGGSEAGNAIADVLFGDVNPSGKITATFPRSLGQVPIYYAQKNTGRPLGNKDGVFEKFKSNYLDERNEPLFPFGYGLSYTKFEYSNLKLSSKTISKTDKLIVSVQVSNTGNYDGKEVIQLYIKDLVGSVTRPLRELKGFKKILIKKNETKEVTFEISIEDLKFYNSDLKFIAENGDFEIFVGTNSDAKLSEKFTLK